MRTRSLKIGSARYKVRRATRLLDDVGETDLNTKNIRLDMSRRPSNRLMLSTLLHEGIHAVIYEYGLQDYIQDPGEELLVQTLENALVHLFDNNKGFSRELLKELLK